VAVAPYSWWGKWFPRGAAFTWWRKGFPEPEPSEAVQAATPTGIALVLEGEATIRWKWETGIVKPFSNSIERRSCHRDDPEQHYDGRTLLVGSQVRAARTQLATHAALGRPFLLGLSYEALVGRPSESASGAVLPVHAGALALCDWAVKGQRVIVRHLLNGSLSSTIQDVDLIAGTIEIATAPGVKGAAGFHIMPAMSVYLEPQQGLQRYAVKMEDTIERWLIKARAAVPGFMSGDIPATLDLGPIATSGAFDGVYYEARDAGADGNGIEVSHRADALVADGEIDEDITGRAIIIRYIGGVTTLGQLATLVEQGSSMIRLRGTYGPTSVMADPDDEFADQPLSGGANAAVAAVGTGATLTTFKDRPVWDHGVRVQGTAGDSFTSMAGVETLGGLPFTSPTTDLSDEGRHIGIKRRLGPYFQWFKLFCWTVRGSWRSFWLPSYRPDLIWESSGAGTITVSDADDGDGSFGSWYPRRRQCVQITTTTGAITYARISGAVKSGDSYVLSIVDEDDNPITIAGTVRQVCWLELVRFERDTVEVKISGGIFESTPLLARSSQHT